ncbi:MAG: type II secretion system protein GspE, partial [Microbacterium sp.]|nr:type II secretion system protein GspE [Microbacterium sp.]
MRGLAQTLAQAGVVRAADLSAALAAVGDGPELPQHLVASHILTERQVAEAVSMHTGAPFVDLANAILDPDVIAMVPSALCRRYQLLPIERSRRGLGVAMLDPTDIIAIDDVSSVTDLQVRPLVVAADALRQAFDRYLRSDEELSDLSEQL